MMHSGSRHFLLFNGAAKFHPPERGGNTREQEVRIVIIFLRYCR